MLHYSLDFFFSCFAENLKQNWSKIQKRLPVLYCYSRNGHKMGLVPSLESSESLPPSALLCPEPACGCLQAGGLSSFVSLQSCMKEVCSPALGARSPNHWTAREVLQKFLKPCGGLTLHISKPLIFKMSGPG